MQIGGILEGVKPRQDRPTPLCKHPGCKNRVRRHSSGLCHHHRDSAHAGSISLAPDQRHAVMVGRAAVVDLLETGYNPNEVFADGGIEATLENNSALGPGEPLQVFSRELDDDTGPPLVLIGGHDTRVDVETASIVIRSLRKAQHLESEQTATINGYDGRAHALRVASSSATTLKASLDNAEGGTLTFLRTRAPDGQDEFILEFESQERDRRSGRRRALLGFTDSGSATQERKTRHCLARGAPETLESEARVWRAAMESVEAQMAKLR